MKIVDELGDMVPSQIYTKIDVILEREEKMRKLYTTALRSSNIVKAAFYTALKKHEPDLVRKLGKICFSSDSQIFTPILVIQI